MALSASERQVAYWRRVVARAEAGEPHAVEVWGRVRARWRSRERSPEEVARNRAAGRARYGALTAAERAERVGVVREWRRRIAAQRPRFAVGCRGCGAALPPRPTVPGRGRPPLYCGSGCPGMGSALRSYRRRKNLIGAVV